MIGNHQRNVQLIKPVAGHRQADQAAPVSRHKVDGLGRDFLGRDHQVAFVLPVFIVNDDDDSAFLDLVDAPAGVVEPLAQLLDDAIGLPPPDEGVRAAGLFLHQGQLVKPGFDGFADEVEGMQD